VAPCILHHADALAFLQTLPDHAVSAVVTDPPYGTGGWVGVGPNRTKRVRHAWDTWTTAWLDDAWRVSGGRVGLFCPTSRLADLYAWAGGRPTRLCVWAKTNPRPQFTGRPAYGFEAFLLIGEVQPCAQPGRLFSDVITTAVENRRRLHPYQKPDSVCAWAVAMVCPPGGAVLDPFMGSGSTGVACRASGRGFIGIERDEGYYRAARERLQVDQADDRAAS
jgi:site-specific DNA-methyltransferase (adenine-specific)